MTDHPQTERLPELPCQDLVELVTAYLDGALSVTDRRRFEAHLAVCSHCVVYVEQIRTTIRLTGRAQADDLPDELREGLRQAFHGWSG